MSENSPNKQQMKLIHKLNRYMHKIHEHECKIIEIKRKIATLQKELAESFLEDPILNQIKGTHENRNRDIAGTT